jgi:uncharacterized protein involved in exopolysaccharide biosynthesis
MAVVFGAVMTATVLVAMVFREYESEMKILVKKERVDLPPPEQTGVDGRQTLDEEDLNTEIELLRSDDVLRNTVQLLHLQEGTSEPLWMQLFGRPTGTSSQIRTAKAVQGLKSGLNVILPKKSNIITIRYGSGDSQLARKVLTALSQFYIEKHMEVRRPPEQFRFFADQAKRYREQLSYAESRLAGFPRTAGTAAGQLELELTENRLGNLRMEYYQNQAAMRQAEKRIGTLETQLASASPRIATVVRSADNQYLIMQVKTTLLNLELKRTELLKKYDPAYRDIQEVDREIAQAQAAVDSAQKSPLRDETTDRDTTYEWMRSELAKSTADLNSFEAKAGSLNSAILAHEREARRLNEKSLQQQHLQREAKTLEENYQLYLRKQEEARINDALDQNKMLNVSIVQSPTAPVIPKRSPTVIVMEGIILAIILSAAGALVSERLDDSFRSPAELESYLEVPVLALLPISNITPGNVAAKQPFRPA